MDTTQGVEKRCPLPPYLNPSMLKAGTAGQQQAEWQQAGTAQEQTAGPWSLKAKAFLGGIAGCAWSSCLEDIRPGPGSLAQCQQCSYWACLVALTDALYSRGRRRELSFAVLPSVCL